VSGSLERTGMVPRVDINQKVTGFSG